MKSLIKPVLVILIVCCATWISFKWTVMRVYVPPDKALMVINKFGDPCPPTSSPSPPTTPSTRASSEELLGPGRYFLDPVGYDWELVDLVQIPAGDPAQLGVGRRRPPQGPAAAP